MTPAFSFGSPAGRAYRRQEGAIGCGDGMDVAGERAKPPATTCPAPTAAKGDARERDEAAPPAPAAMAARPDTTLRTVSGRRRSGPLMRQVELVERVQAYIPDVDESLLNRAYVYAMRAHQGQVRASGDPYFSHPLEVAAIVTDMRLDVQTVVAALLHDTIEDTDTTRPEIDRLFGPEIGKLVDGLTKLKRIDLVSRKSRQGENLRQLLLAVAADVRVLLVKLADRLHNMRTLHHTKAEQQARIAEETMDIYAPLAGRMGMQDMRSELEELAFSHLFPDAHATICAKLDPLARENRNLIAEIEADLTHTLAGAGVPARVRGRQKKPYSVFRKMEHNRISFEQLSDIFGFRVVVDAVPDCYRALGHVHTRYTFVPGRFKDYISNPKQNDYQSLHTTVVGPSRQRVEMQIRTEQMHEVAEYGIAAHSIYKDGNYVAANASLPRSKTSGGPEATGGAVSPSISRAYAWLRRTVESIAQGDHPDDLVEQTRLELFVDQVFCFTPNGRLIALPQGATPIDFAYAVHTDIGNTCVGCRINGQTAPVVTQLANGDEVEILTDPEAEVPAVWEKLVVTGRARAGIRRAARQQSIETFAHVGASVLERAYERAGLAYDRAAVEAAVPKLARSSLGDLLASVAKGEIPSADVLRATHPDYKPDRALAPTPADRENWFSLGALKSVIFHVPGLMDAVGGKVGETRGSDWLGRIPVRGAPIGRDGEGVAVRFDPVGGAVPGDRIVGVATQGELTDFRGITVYPIQSQALQDFEDRSEGWLDLRWDIEADTQQRFPARIRLGAANKPGTLARVCGVFAECNVNISSLHLAAPEREVAVIDFGVEVWDAKHIARLLRQLRALDVVSRVDRVHDLPPATSGHLTI